MGVVRAQEEEHDGDTHQELFGRRVLGPIIDLFPHVEVVVGSSVELERHPTDVVEHEVRAKHVRNVGQRP